MNDMSKTALISQSLVPIIKYLEIIKNKLESEKYIHVTDVYVDHGF